MTDARSEIFVNAKKHPLYLESRMPSYKDKPTLSPDEQKLLEAEQIKISVLNTIAVSEQKSVNWVIRIAEDKTCLATMFIEEPKLTYAHCTVESLYLMRQKLIKQGKLSKDVPFPYYKQTKLDHKNQKQGYVVFLPHLQAYTVDNLALGKEYIDCSWLHAGAMNPKNMIKSLPRLDRFSNEADLKELICSFQPEMDGISKQRIDEAKKYSDKIALRKLKPGHWAQPKEMLEIFKGIQLTIHNDLPSMAHALLFRKLFLDFLKNNNTRFKRFEDPDDFLFVGYDLPKSAGELSGHVCKSSTIMHEMAKNSDVLIVELDELAVYMISKYIVAIINNCIKPLSSYLENFLIINAEMHNGKCLVFSLNFSSELDFVLRHSEDFRNQLFVYNEYLYGFNFKYEDYRNNVTTPADLDQVKKQVDRDIASKSVEFTALAEKIKATIEMHVSKQTADAKGDSKSSLESKLMVDGNEVPSVTGTGRMFLFTRQVHAPGNQPREWVQQAEAARKLFK